MRYISKAKTGTYCNNHRCDAVSSCKQPQKTATAGLETAKVHFSACVSVGSGVIIRRGVGVSITGCEMGTGKDGIAVIGAVAVGIGVGVSAAVGYTTGESVCVAFMITVGVTFRTRVVFSGCTGA